MRALPLLLALVLSLPGCDAVQDLLEPEPTADTLDGMAAAATGDPLRPYVFVHEDGERMAVGVDPATDRVTEVLVIAPDVEFVVDVGPDGAPTQLTVGETVVVVENVREDLVDLAVLDPEGGTTVIRDVPTDPEMAGRLAALRSGREAAQAPSISGAFNAAAIAVGIVGCAVVGVGGVAAAVQIPVPAVVQLTASGVVACTGTIASIYQRRRSRQGATDEELRPTSAGITAMSTTANAVDCRGYSPTACAELVLNTFGALIEYASGVREALGLAIASARGILYGTGGDVEVVLSWDNEADLDLWVADPSGERVWFRNRTAVSGGTLEFDDTNGYGPERIYWPSGAAPPGVYTIQVDHYAGPTAAGWRVLRVVDGRAEAYSGTIYDDQTVTVAQFVVQAPREGGGEALAGSSSAPRADPLAPPASVARPAK